MTHAAATNDPLRAEVEVAVRRVLTDLVSLPCQVVRAAGDQVARPVGLARSLVALATGGLLGRTIGDAPVGSARAERPSAPVAAGSGAATRSTALDAALQGDETTRTEAAADARHLPIDEYESLAASQVVARLDRLEDDELRRIAEFETVHRGRRTVLGKIDQLLAART